VVYDEVRSEQETARGLAFVAPGWWCGDYRGVGARYVREVGKEVGDGGWAPEVALLGAQRIDVVNILGVTIGVLALQSSFCKVGRGNGHPLKL
jgi:hypothetical protein